jgi:hypothetical protein
MLKTKIIPIVLGFIAASAVMMLFEFTNSFLFPFGDGFDTSDIEAVRAFAAMYSPQIFYMVLAGWAVGALSGGYVTAWLSGERQFRASAALALLLVLAGVANHLMFQHPLWFNIVAFSALVGGTYLGWYVYQHKEHTAVCMSTVIGVGAMAAVLVGAAYVSNRAPQERVMEAPHANTSFFITSVNPGKGGDLGGLSGADAYCTKLATQAGIEGKTWAAYLSVPARDGKPAVHARLRIGSGPWYNVRGVMIATSVDSLHGENNLNKDTALTEYGTRVHGRGDTPNEHDILTGSTESGYASDSTEDTSCAGWTSSTEGSALVGHHDRIGRDESAPMKSWNAAHPSRGCSMDGLRSTGGAGLLYCFAR